MKFYKVTIDSTKFIPFINRQGPIYNPLNINEVAYNNLRKLGFDILVHSVVDDNFNVTHLKVPSIEVDIVSKSIPLNEVSDKEIDTSSNTTLPSVFDEEVEDKEVVVEEVPVEGVVEAVEHIEIEVFERDVYVSMSKRDLSAYINKLKDALPTELFPVEGKTHKELMNVIDSYILS